MADLIEIGIEVRSGSVKSATRELDQLGNSVKSAQRSASAFVEAFARQEKQLDKVVAANKRYAESARQAAKDAQVFYKGLQQANLANKSAADSADVFAKRLEQLKQKYNPLYATSRQYENMLNEINEAHMLGALNTQQFEAAQERLNKEFTQGTGAFAKYQRQFSQGFNQMGVISQQVGYQVGDFLVQIQSGTNPMVAFGQQATQLLGVLYLLPAPVMASTVAIGALRISVTALIASVSIILPLLTAIGAYFLRSGEDAKKAKQEVDNYTAALENLEQKAQKFKEQRLELTTGFDPEVLAASAERIRLQEIYDRKVVESLNFEGKKKELAENLLETLRSQISAETQKIQKLYDAARLEEERLKKVKEAKEWEEGANERIAKRGTFMKYYNSLLDEAEKKAKETKEWEDGANERIAKRGTFMKYYNELLDEAKKKEEERLRLLQQAESYYTSQSQSLQTQLSLIEAEVYLRKNYTDEQYIQNRLEQTKVSLMAEQNGLSNKQRQELIALTAQLQTEKELLDDINKAEVRRLAIIEARKSSGQREPVFDPRDPNYVGAEKAHVARLKEMIESGELYNSTLDKTTKKTKANTAATKDNRTAYEKAMMTAQEFADALDNQVIRAVDGVADAFSTFLQNGMKDFKSFVGSIKNMFIQLLADMAAMALKRQILIPIATGTAAGFGSTAAASAMGQYAAGGAQAGTIGATLATGMSNFGSAALHTITGGTAGSVAAGSTMASIGAVAPYILAAVAVIGLFTKKVKQLDSGLRVTIDSTGTLVEQFNKLQTSRLFGLIKRTSTSYAQAGADVADPIVDAIGNMQQSIIDAAGTLGIGAAAFDNFSYQFKVSLKGLTEEEQLQKINEEITKMGDSFASLSGHFSTMNELLAAAQQRYDIETRLLGLLNNQSALLTRQREAERAATNELNRGLLEQVYKLEDAYSAVNSAFAVVQRSIEARKTAITNSFNEIMETIQGRIEAAQAAVGVSGGIVSSLEGAAGGSGMTRGAGLAYLRSLRGASRITDQKKLDDALQAIADPSQDLYTNFVDYQRDFQDQTNLVRELEEKAKLQLSTDEQTLLQLQEEAKAAQARYDSQIEKLDEQLANAQAQLDALYGIDTSVKSVTEAISALGVAINGAMAAQSAAKAFQSAAGVGGTGAAATGKSFSEQYGTGSQYKGYDLAKLSGSGDLLAAAAMLGVGTTGKTGAQIQQAISNASGMAVRLDNATRSQQFAMGGMFGGGLRMVGERGPELEATGPSRIFSTKQTSELFRNPELVDEVRSLRSEVAGLRSENRQLQTSISKYSKRNYDINRKWDTDGLPATRT